MKKLSICLTLLSTMLFVLGCGDGSGSKSGSKSPGADPEAKATGGEIKINPDPDIAFVEDPG